MGREIQVDCENCKGEGSHEERHQSWGIPTCPEAYVIVECGECDGTGLVLVDTDDDGE